jgi:glyoxylase-like metal-dependent hydrolase (beta-lactamase superfamily II)
MMRPFQLPPQRRLHWLSAGCCTHPEWITKRGGRLRSVRFPAGFGCMEHPEKGVILFDTGYSYRFFEETRHLPAILYRWLTPVSYREEDSALSQLSRLGYTPEDVSVIVISHFHGDHIAGLRDFPLAQFIFAQEAYDKVRKLHGLAAVRAGYLPGLLPADFEARSRPFQFKEAESTVPLPVGCPFSTAVDLLGDGRLLAVDLPGHAFGQFGLFVSTDQHDYLLCADAAWSSHAIRDNLPPNPLAGLIMSNGQAYNESFKRLIELNRRFPSVRIIPTHCVEWPPDRLPKKGEE